MNSTKYLTLALAALLFVLPACEPLNERLEEINVDPNNPTEVPLSVLLPEAQVNITYGVVAGDAAFYSSVWTQHTTGVHAQLWDADQLVEATMNPNMLNNIWNNAYWRVLNDLDIIIDRGTETGLWSYVGVAKILTAYTLAYLTDIHGRIPWTEALQGEDGVLKPKYDTQESIYQEVQRLLDEAIADLGKPSAALGTGDVIMGGSLPRWTRTAWALKARYYNRLSKRDPQGSATAAIAAANNGYQSAEEELIFRGYQTASAHQHPWHREYNQRRHHAYSQRMLTLQEAHNDPRIALWGRPMPSGAIVAAPNGNALQDQAGAHYSKILLQFSPTAPQPLMLYSEQEFIKAEAHLRLGQRDLAHAAFLRALDASLDYGGVSAAAKATYLAQEATVPSAANLTLQRIIEEKWLMFFLFQPVEAWNDWRRTGFPTLTNPRGEIPRRFPYPQREFDNNKENVPVVTVRSGVWWDDGTED